MMPIKAKPATAIIKWRPARSRLIEGVTDGLEFALASAGGQQATQFSHCKDFLHDAILSAIRGESRGIYGFQYNPKTDPPIDLDHLRLLVANSEDKSLREGIPGCIDFLHQIEHKLKITPSKILECANPPAKYRCGGAFYFEGSRRWLTAPVMVSLYALLIRIGLGHPAGNNYWKTVEEIVSGAREPYQSVDAPRMRCAKKGIETILRRGDRRVFGTTRQIKGNYPDVDISTFHNDFGIVGFANGSTKSYVPRWHK